MCDGVVSKDPFLLVYCSDKYITQKMCDEAVDYSLATLKLILDWFVTNKMIKELFTVLYASESILYLNEDSGIVIISVMKWVFLIRIMILLILIIILINMILIPLFMSDFWLSILNLKKAKHSKKS